jgi:hypothetical protein
MMIQPLGTLSSTLAMDRQLNGEANLGKLGLSYILPTYMGGLISDGHQV